MKKITFIPIFYSTLLIFALLLSAKSEASNRYYADSTLEPSIGFVWDWTLGGSYSVEDTYLVGLSNYNDGLDLDISLAISYNNFYLDFDHSQLSGGLIIGYSLINKYDWDLDLLATNTQAGFDEEGLGFYNNGIISQLKNIKTRKYDFAAGVRLTRKYQNSQISFEYLYDIAGAHNSWVANTFFSHIRPVGNWEIRSGVGLSAYSAGYTNYYFGINTNEVTPTRPHYKPHASTSIMLELHAEYPINQNWVFLTGWLGTWFSDEITNSPIISQGYQHKAKLGIRYVF